MSGYLVNKSLLDPTVTQYSGGTTSFTLPQSGSTNATEVFVGGVPQVAGVDFNISGTALTLTTSAPAGANMVCVRQYFSDGITGTAGANTVATSAIQNDSVTGGKLNPALVAGDIIYADGTDTINRLAKGAASQQLAMNAGATAPEWVAPATSDYVRVGSTVLTGTASSIDFLTLDTTTYKHFVFYIYAVLSTTAILQARLNNTGGALETGATSYRWGNHYTYIGAAAKADATDGDESDNQIDIGQVSPSANTPIIGQFWLHNPDVAADKTHFKHYVISTPNTTYHYMSDGGGYMNAVGAHNGISFYPASGTFISGDMIQAYGVK